MATKKKISPQFINLQDELLLQVDGQEEKKHVLSWEILKEIGDTTQKLITKLAKYSLEKQSVPLESIKLNFTGFYTGSAVPALQLITPPNLLFPVDNYYKTLNADFNFVIDCIDKGNFQGIADKYQYPAVKNEIVKSVYEFTNSTGTKPLNIVRRSERNHKEFAKVASVRKMSSKVLALLYVPEPVNYELKDVDQGIEAVGKFLLKKTSKGRTQKKEVQLYTQKEAVLSLRFDSIETEKRIYILSGEILFSLKGDAKSSFVIENPTLDIYAFGETMDEAEEELFHQFDYTYQRLNSIGDEKLSLHLRKAKQYINLIVESVKEK